MSKEYNREMIDELYRNELKYRRFIEYLNGQLDEEIAELGYTGFEIHEKLKREIIEALEKEKE